MRGVYYSACSLCYKTIGVTENIRLLLRDGLLFRRLLLPESTVHGSKAANQIHVQLIIENIDNKNPQDDHEVTPLHLAAQAGHFEICQYIIENVNEKNPENWRGNTPLHYAAKRGQIKICWFIIITIEQKNPR